MARIFNTYGPNMHPHDGRVVSNFMVQALLGRDLTIYGDHSHTRSFCYADDLIDAVHRLMDSPGDVTGPVNLGNPDEIAIRELAGSVIDLTGSSSDIVHLPSPEDDPARRCPDISLARQVLRWEPKVRLADGLERTIEYFDRLLGRPMYDDPSAVSARARRDQGDSTSARSARQGASSPVPELLTGPTRSRMTSLASDPCSTSRTIEDMYTTVGRWLPGTGTYAIAGETRCGS